MSEPEASTPLWSGERRSGGSGVSTAAPRDEVARDPADAVESLRDGLSFCTSPRMYVAAFEIDVPRLFRFAVDTLPAALRAHLMERFTAAEDLPCGPRAQLYGVLTGLSGGTSSAAAPIAPPVRVRLIPPYRLPQEFLFVLENASRRAEDDPVKSYWVPLQCVSHGSVTAVDPETVQLDHPSVVYRIEEGVLKLEAR
ncbi:MAG: hypothetical protein ABIT01_20700 [Thermoanaerobaculia bacterium]